MSCETSQGKPGGPTGGTATASGPNLDALVLGWPSAERATFVERLSAAGVDTQTCRDDAWGCAGLHDACPLDEHAVDAAVAFGAPGEELDPQGVACAMRARVPIVVFGGLTGDIVHDLADATVTPARDGATAPIDAVCWAIGQAATAAHRHRQAIERAAAEFCRPGEQIEIDVRRSQGALRVAISGEFEPLRTGEIADRVRAAARRFDPNVAVIDVVVDATR